MPSATETPQPRAVFQKAGQEAVRLCLNVYYGQLRRTTIGSQKSSPLVPLGLHSFFACLRTINPSLFFSVMFFAINPSFIVMFFSKTTISTHAKESKKSRQKKTTR